MVFRDGRVGGNVKHRQFYLHAPVFHLAAPNPQKEVIPVRVQILGKAGDLQFIFDDRMGRVGEVG